MVYKKDYNKAQEYYTSFLEMKKSTLEKNNIKVVEYLSNIDNIWFSDEEYSEAIEYYTECLEIQEWLLGKNSIEASESLKNIGNV